MTDEDGQQDRFRAAVRALRNDDYASRLALGSLVASVQGNTKYELIAREETAPRAGELDLHLTGEGVEGHSTNAAAFGEFVRQMAEAVKVVSRERMGRKRFVSDLLIEPGPGSVRALFRTPDPVPSDALEDPEDDPIWKDPNRQSAALHEIATLLAHSEPGEDEADLDSGVVDALVAALPAKARPKLISAVGSIAKQGWDVEGEFRQLGLGIEPIRLGNAGARRLTTALQVRQRDETTWTTTGIFDGHRRSRGLSWFISDGSESEITVVVPTPELSATVADLATDSAPSVVATFTVLTTHGPGTSDSGRKSYILSAVRRPSEAPPATLEGL